LWGGFWGGGGGGVFGGGVWGGVVFLGVWLVFCGFCWGGGWGGGLFPMLVFSFWCKHPCPRMWDFSLSNCLPLSIMLPACRRSLPTEVSGGAVPFFFFKSPPPCRVCVSAPVYFIRCGGPPLFRQNTQPPAAPSTLLSSPFVFFPLQCLPACRYFVPYPRFF